MKLTRPVVAAMVASCFSFVLAPSAVGQGSHEKVAVSLHDGWFVQSAANVSATGSQISTPGYAPTGWLKTSIPATPVGAEVENGVYPDPHVGLNAQRIPCWPAQGINYANQAWPSGCPYGPGDWWFLNQFTLPTTLSGQRIYLHFDGINYRANLWVNGTQIDNNTHLVGTYTGWEYDITGVANIGAANAVALDIQGPSSSDLAIVFVDWYPLPADRDEGIWRDAWITNSGPVKVRFPQVQTSVSADLSSASLTVTAELSNPTNASVTGTLSGTITPGNISFSQTVTLLAATSSQVFTFTPTSYPQLVVASPALWWPHDLGPQNLYQCQMQFSVGSTVSDTNTFNFGIRKLDTGLGPVDPSGKQWRWFQVNNVPLLIKGAGWAPDMMLKATRDPMRLKETFDLVTDMGMNALRFEGKMEDQAFYDLADQYGVLLMAGWVCCSQWEKWGSWSTENHTVANTSLDTQMRALRNHPSAFVWVNSSDLLPPASDEQQEVNIEKADNWPNPVEPLANYGSSTITGLNGWEEGGPYEWEPPMFWYFGPNLAWAHGFLTEGSVGPDIPAMESMITGLQENPINYPEDSTWDWHMGGTPFGNLNVVDSALGNRYGSAPTATDYIRKMQMQNYESWRAQYESYETNRSKTDGSASTGIILWMLTSGWFSLHWQTFDWYLRPSSAYFAVKLSAQPLHVSWDYDFNNNVTVTNDYPQSFTNLTVTVDVLDVKLVNKYHNSATLNVSPHSSTVAFTIPHMSTLGITTTTYYVRLRMTDSSGNAITNNFYWYSTTPDGLKNSCRWFVCLESHSANLTALATLPNVTISHSDSIGVNSVTTTLTNPSTSTTAALLIRARVTNGGNEVLPVFWSDNYISLLPGESRTLTANFEAGTLPPGSIVQIDGFNINSN